MWITADSAVISFHVSALLQFAALLCNMKRKANLNRRLCWLRVDSTRAELVGFCTWHPTPVHPLCWLPHVAGEQAKACVPLFMHLYSSMLLKHAFIT